MRDCFFERNQRCLILKRKMRCFFLFCFFQFYYLLLVLTETSTPPDTFHQISSTFKFNFIEIDRLQLSSNDFFWIKKYNCRRAVLMSLRWHTSRCGLDAFFRPLISGSLVSLRITRDQSFNSGSHTHSAWRQLNLSRPDVPLTAPATDVIKS